MDFLSACVFGEDDYKSNAHVKILLDIFDNHPNKYKRLMVLHAMNGYKSNVLLTTLKNIT